MFDALTSSYTLSCPLHGETRVRLSRFRRLEQLQGPQHPAVYRVEFACGCGSEHPALVTHADLDLTPLGLQDDTPFLNLMTSRLEAVGGEFGALAAARIKAGEWPWSFYCWPEARPRPVFPSAFKLLAPSAGDDRVVLHDDVLATGGTIAAIKGLVESVGGVVVGACFIIDLTFLGGRERLADIEVFSLIQY